MSRYLAEGAANEHRCHGPPDVCLGRLSTTYPEMAHEICRRPAEGYSGLSDQTSGASLNDPPPFGRKIIRPLDARTDASAALCTSHLPEFECMLQPATGAHAQAAFRRRPAEGPSMLKSPTIGVSLGDLHSFRKSDHRPPETRAGTDTKNSRHGRMPPRASMLATTHPTDQKPGRLHCGHPKRRLPKSGTAQTAESAQVGAPPGFSRQENCLGRAKKPE